MFLGTASCSYIKDSVLTQSLSHYDSTVSNQPCICTAGHTGPHCEYQEGDVPDCSLSCQNGSACKIGRPDPIEDRMAYDKYLQTSVDIKFMWCDCPTGYHGELCEIPSIPCGEHLCFNNAECIEKENHDGSQTHMCSCQKSEGGLSYAGRYCQYEATSYCSNGNSFEGDNFFCTNGGQCREEAWLGCDCPQGYDGFSCGYFVGFDSSEETKSSPAKCDLDCNGRGTCVPGLKSLSYLGSTAHAEHLNATNTNDLEHCVCQNGFTGLQCEHDVERCGEEDGHFCLHGSKCTKTPGGGSFCDCTTATSQLAAAFAGLHCEHPATSMCIDSESQASIYSSFCVNDGVCNPNATTSPTW